MGRTTTKAVRADGTKPLTNQQIANHFGFSAPRAAALIREGMPLDSLENAEAWRQQRLLRSRRGRAVGVTPSNPVVIDPTTVNPDDDFEQTVARHRELKETARQTYIEAGRTQSAGDAAKYYQTYQNILKTLVVIEREALARRIESKDLIKTSSALDRFNRVLGEIKADLTGLPVQIASQLNPNNPGLALKILDKHLNALMTKWSQGVGRTVEEMVQPIRTSAPSIDAMGDDEPTPEPERGE